MGTCQGKQLKKQNTYLSAKNQVKRLYDVEIEPVGKGAFAKVFKGSLKTNPSVKVAIKVFKKASLTSSGLKAIREEVKVLWKLDHPHIVKYNEVYEDSKHVFIVTEYLEGKTLCEELKNRNTHYTEYEIAQIMHQLVSAIYHCHANNIAHRDIKPDNIIIDQNNIVTLIDFGLSKAYSKERNLKTKAGSPLFMAPEAENHQQYSSQWDIWSLGVLFFILLSGRVPFTIEKYNKIVKQEEECEVNFEGEIWEKTSNNAKKLIKRMLVFEPNDRVSIQEILDHKWFSVLKNESTACEEDLTTDYVLESLQTFRCNSVLKYAALKIFVNLMPNNKFKQFYAEFAKLDEDKDGMISSKDLKRYSRRMHGKTNGTQIQDIIEKLDFNKNG